MGRAANNRSRGPDYPVTADGESQQRRFAAARGSFLASRDLGQVFPRAL